ncbi:efflux RND transporter permease subunit [Thiolinea disciformis]|uniref:efflux RND transporter permease subunit n=1 Tax=Thiolinea disciformis TaxID=125614 RepID=UPI0003704D8E|nr:efflux RND transporter permease subunit [Thiolinea disciformis]
MNDSPQPVTGKAHALGLAGKIAQAFINSPLSLLLLLSFLAIGILGLMVTPRQEDPQISVPMVDVFVRYPGASAQEVEAIIARPLEAILFEMTGVEHVYSASARGEAMVTVQFKVGEQLEPSLVKLYDKLSSNRDAIPIGASEPLVKPKGVDDVPAVTLTLWSNQVDDASLRLVGMEVLQALRSVPNTSQSFIVDGRREELQVDIMPERLANFGVSLDQVANTIRMANSERAAGAVEPDNHVYKVYTGSFLTSAEDINRLMVTVVDGRPVYVRDVADVKEGPSEAKSMVGYYTGPAYQASNNKPIEVAANAAAVTLAIAKKHGTNGVDVAEAILNKVETLKGRIIPDNIHVEVTRNYGATAKAKVDELLKKLFIATGIVTVLVWLALGWRAAMVVLIVIPVVITTTVFSAWILNMTIDRVSLFALIFSIGILVDDAIVVVENIYRRWLLAAEQSLATAVDAVREVGNPTILATFTVIAALLPMGFVSGMMGPYMMPIPVLGSVAMIISLFAAFAFTPWLTNQLKPSLSKLNQDAEKEHRQAQRLDRFFRQLIIPLVNNRALGYGVLLVIILGFFALMTLFYPFKAVPVKMLPLDNKPEFNVVVNMPEGTALPVTANLIQDLSVELNKIPEVVALQTYSGTASPYNFNGLVRHYYLRQQAWQGDIQVQLLDKKQRKRTSHELAVLAREVLTPIAAKQGAKIQVVEMPPGPPVLQTVVAEIYNPDAATRRKVAEDMTEFFGKVDNLTDVDNMLEADHNILRFIVDADKAQRKGISVEDVNRTLEMAMGGYVLGDIKKNALIDPTKIVLQVPLSARSQIMRLIQLPVTNQQGKSVPLSELGRFESDQPQDKPIYHKDLAAVEFVTAEGTGRLAAPVYGQSAVEGLLQTANEGKGYVTPDGTTLTQGHWFKAPDLTKFQTAFVWSGEWTVTFETFRDMGIAFMAALVLIYMLIVAQFGNFILPAIIMAPIPLTLMGILPGHWIMGAEFTATSMIGFIALAGIIVRNSILLVDFAREAVAEGTPVMEAVIRSCEARTRPIMITALALLGGSMVILSDPIFQGMAVSLIFGGAVATLLTLIIIPLGCISAGNSLVPPPNDPHQPLNSDGLPAQTVLGEQSHASGSTRDSSLMQKLILVGQYFVMYCIALVSSFVIGLRDTFKALLKWIKKRQSAKKAQQSRRKAQTVANSASRSAELPKTIIVDEPTHTSVEPLSVLEPVAKTAEAELNATEQKPEALEPEPMTAVKPKAKRVKLTVDPVEAHATDTELNHTETSQAIEPNADVPKPTKRRGIKLKKDI